MPSCSCGQPARHSTPLGVPKCDRHWAEFVSFSAAGSAMSTGSDPAEAVGIGIAAGGFAGESEQERANAARRRQRLEQATGFWQRLKIRLIG